MSLLPKDMLEGLRIARAYMAEWIETKEAAPLYPEDLLACAKADLAIVDSAIAKAKGSNQ